MDSGYIVVTLRKRYRDPGAAVDRDAAAAKVEGFCLYSKSGSYRSRTGPSCCNGHCGAAWRRKLAKMKRYNFMRRGGEGG